MAAEAVVTTGHWLGPPGRPLLGWLSTRVTGPAASGVVVLPPVAYQYWTAHRTLRVLAERLAADGHLVLRVDYDGTGDAAGTQFDEDRMSAWRASVRMAAAELRRLGCERVTLAGARLGATLALLEAGATGAEAVALWAPVVSGRRYAKELRLLSMPVPGPDGTPESGDGTVVSAGTVFTPSTLAAISAVDLVKQDLTPPPTVRIVEGFDGGSERLADALERPGCRIERLEIAGGERALETPTEYATVPDEIVAALRDGVPRAGGRIASPPVPRRTAELTWDGMALSEEVLALGPDGLAGILATPRDAEPDAPAVVFLNSGSEPHVGPGRAWVEYARALAARGHVVVRADYSGWGESPDLGHAPGRPYDSHCEDETLALVAALRARGYRDVVLAGLCAGAWVSLRAILREPVAGVVALNPQLYWRPGDPVEATMTETRVRRAGARRREARGARWGWWTALDLLGQRTWTSGWLDRIGATGVPILMLFAEGDDGLDHLRDRAGRRFARLLRGGRVVVEEISGIDHSMHHVWRRDAIVTAIARFLDTLPLTAASRPAADPTATLETAAR